MALTGTQQETRVAGTEEVVDFFAGGCLLVKMETGLGHEEVDRRIKRALRGGDVCHRALAFYLHELRERRLFQAFGFSDVVGYAEQRLGMNKSKAYELLATGKSLAELPRLDQAFAEGGLSWSKVRRIARIATADTEQAWIKRARGASHGEVEAMVSACDRGDAPPHLDRGLPKARFVLKLTLDALQHEMLEMAREKLQAERGGQVVTDTMLVEEAVRLILSSHADGSVPGREKVDDSLFRVLVRGEGSGENRSGDDRGAPAQRADAVAASPAQLEAAASDAALTPRMRRRVLERDGYRCCCCGSRRGLMIHHVVWRSRGGATTMDNTQVLCAGCHGLVHDQLLFVSGRPGQWVFTDRRGRDLHGSVLDAGSGVQLRVDSTMVERAKQPRAGRDELAEPGPTLESVDDIPDQIDVAWLRRQEHLLEWTPGGQKLRMKCRSRR